MEPVGVLTLEFDDGEVFQWSKVYIYTNFGFYFCCLFGSEIIL